MARLVLVRLATTLGILLGVSFVSFILMRTLPGDFANLAADTTRVSPEVLEGIRKELGLDRPLLEQYALWLGAALTGNFGNSFITRAPVLSELWPRLFVTVQLTVVAIIMSTVIGVTTGLASARLRGGFDWAVRVFNGFSAAVPNFVTGTLIVLLAGLYFSHISVLGYVPFLRDPWGSIGSLLLPGLTLALGTAVGISENTRAAVLEVSGQDYVMVARAKGLRPSTVLRNYLMRNALTPIITVSGLSVAGLLGGSILVETIFAVPGMGQYLFEAIVSRDYPVIQVLVLVAAAIVVFVNMLVDIAYAVADARVKL